MIFLLIPYLSKRKMKRKRENSYLTGESLGRNKLRSHGILCAIVNHHLCVSLDFVCN